MFGKFGFDSSVKNVKPKKQNKVTESVKFVAKSVLVRRISILEVTCKGLRDLRKKIN
jgi:hypothetical protein